MTLSEIQPGDRVVEPGPRIDARRLRGLAHPMRVQILELLELDGPATATILAERLGVRSGSTSWHLLKLAEHGFVEEVTGRGDRRQRWWRAAGSGWSMDHAEFVGDAELADASETLLSAVVSQQMLRANRFLQQDWTDAWRRSWILSTEFQLQLDPAGLAALKADLEVVIERYRRRPAQDDHTEAGAAEGVDTQAGVDRGGEDQDGRAQIVLQMQGFPYRPAGR